MEAAILRTALLSMRQSMTQSNERKIWSASKLPNRPEAETSRGLPATGDQLTQSVQKPSHLISPTDCDRDSGCRDLEKVDHDLQQDFTKRHGGEIAGTFRTSAAGLAMVSSWTFDVLSAASLISLFPKFPFLSFASRCCELSGILSEERSSLLCSAMRSRSRSEFLRSGIFSRNFLLESMRKGSPSTVLMK